ncbi:hypothetical protein [Fodinibius sp. Rm-B-1B1-1]|uniref:hypothetical protein n=1 Tax=Fodinibius alkaliphilus TaxID=3140241 RepID=UPI00315A1821
MAFFQSRFFIITILLLGLFPSLLYAQQQVGVHWDMPTNSQTTQKQLEQFDQLGITIIEVNQLPQKDTWTLIDSLGFQVYGNLGIDFPISDTFANPDSTLIQNIERKSNSFLSQSSVRAIGIFNFGNIYNPTFWQAIDPIVSQLKQVDRITLYQKSLSYDTPSALPSVISVPVTSSNWNSLAFKTTNAQAYLYNPASELHSLLTPFKRFLESIDKPQAKNTPIIVESEWLFSTLEKYPQFSEILKSITTDQDPAFPLPQEEVPVPSNNVFPIIMLFIIWLTIGLHYNMSPLYRKSLFRYFTAHKFFINDIFKRLIRSPFPSVIILIQNALLIALSAYSLFINLFGPVGQHAFFYHFSTLSTFGDGPLSIFLWTLAIILLFSLLEIIWLFVTHKRINSLTQIATIFSWPLQINLLFCTIVITFFTTTSTFTPILFTSLALILFIASYIFTAIDLSRFSHSKLFYHLKTSIPYSLAILAFLGWVINQEQWKEVIKLALNLT